MSALVWLLLSASHTFWVGLIVTGPLLGGLSFYYLKKIRGQPTELQDAFAGFTMAFPQLLLTSLLSGLLITLGLALCVIPGIYLAVAWSLALPLAIDKQLGFWQAMELNRQAIYEEARGNHAAAIATYELAAQAAGATWSPALFNLALLHYRQREYERALGVINRAIAADDDPPSQTLKLRILKAMRPAVFKDR